MLVFVFIVIWFIAELGIRLNEEHFLFLLCFLFLCMLIFVVYDIVQSYMYEENMPLAVLLELDDLLNDECTAIVDKTAGEIESLADDFWQATTQMLTFVPSAAIDCEELESAIAIANTVQLTLDAAILNQNAFKALLFNKLAEINFETMVSEYIDAKDEEDEALVTSISLLSTSVDDINEVIDIIDESIIIEVVEDSGSELTSEPASDAVEDVLEVEEDSEESHSSVNLLVSDDLINPYSSEIEEIMQFGENELLDEDEENEGDNKDSDSELPYFTYKHY